MQQRSEFIRGRAALGLLILRIAAGYALMVHGSIHLQHPFEWMGDVDAPGLVQGLCAAAEFVGGLAMLLGILTPVACVSILLSAITALFVVHIPHGDPLVVSTSLRAGSCEGVFIYSAVSILLILLGPGTLSMDALLFQRKRQIRTSIRRRQLVMLR